MRTLCTAFFLVTSSVNLHGRVNLAHEDVASIEADGPGEAEEGVGDDEHVTEVHRHGHQLRKHLTNQFALDAPSTKRDVIGKNEAHILVELVMTSEILQTDCWPQRDIWSMPTLVMSSLV